MRPPLRSRQVETFALRTAFWLEIGIAGRPSSAKTHIAHSAEQQELQITRRYASTKSQVKAARLDLGES